MRKILLLVVSLPLVACIDEAKSKVDLDKLTSIHVEIGSGSIGTEGAPLPFDPAGAPFALTLTAINGKGEVKQDFQGPVVITSQPGKITGSQITFGNGEGTADFTLEKAFGKTRIWVEDPETFATGVTEPIFYRGPKITDVQKSTNSTIASPFEESRVPIDDTTSLVVTAIARDGFYITDVDATEWASIFAYTFSAPQGLSVGDKITDLSGRVSEFLGFTELNNPAWKPDGNLPVPAPIVVTCAEIGASAPNLVMESFEAGLIEITNAVIEICPSFPSCQDYDDYRQWSIHVGPPAPGGCSINAVSRYTVAGFDPLANEGETIVRAVGTLRHIQFADPEWILEPRGTSDICCPTCTPALNQGC